MSITLNTILITLATAIMFFSFLAGLVGRVIDTSATGRKLIEAASIMGIISIALKVFSVILLHRHQKLEKDIAIGLLIILIIAGILMLIAAIMYAVASHRLTQIQSKAAKPTALAAILTIGGLIIIGTSIFSIYSAGYSAGTLEN